ncbi:hypothetical protein CDAR_30351 [Caerostris darwini]|uniref:Uncharacterized protein n=1 Tax=Caerostris darwini TaxID=1538125 RepID=A0AAV4VWG6_9ARAC|nr:hypothetical protein CDAR_30351 [Caerostris darwini]
MLNLSRKFSFKTINKDEVKVSFPKRQQTNKNNSRKFIFLKRHQTICTLSSSQNGKSKNNNNPLSVESRKKTIPLNKEQLFYCLRKRTFCFWEVAAALRITFNLFSILPPEKGARQYEEEEEKYSHKIY